MAFEFKLPDIGEGVHEGEILKWFVNEGDVVKVDTRTGDYLGRVAVAG